MDRNVGARIRERQRDRAADTDTAAGDQRAPADIENSAATRDSDSFMAMSGGSTHASVKERA